MDGNESFPWDSLEFGEDHNQIQGMWQWSLRWNEIIEDLIIGRDFDIREQRHSVGLAVRKLADSHD